MVPTIASELRGLLRFDVRGHVILVFDGFAYLAERLAGCVVIEVFF